MAVSASAAARANQRSILDLETLQSVNDTLIRTVEEVREIHREGMAKRKQIGSEIAAMRNELETRLAATTN